MSHPCWLRFVGREDHATLDALIDAGGAYNGLGYVQCDGQAAADQVLLALSGLRRKAYPVSEEEAKEALRPVLCWRVAIQTSVARATNAGEEL